VILVDANLLIFAINEDSPFHVGARRWLDETLSGTTPVGLSWVVVLAFLRITTRQGIMGNPLPLEEALAYVSSWLEQPFVQPISPGHKHWPILRDLLKAVGTGGNLTSDAHLAALAAEYGSTVYSTDNDFQLFPGIHHVNPLALKP